MGHFRLFWKYGQKLPVCHTFWPLKRVKKVASRWSCELQVTSSESQRTAVEVSGEKVEGTWHFSRVHFLTKDLPRQTKMETSSEGNFSVSMNTSLSAPFQEERLGLGLYQGGGGGVNVKIQMKMLAHIFGFEIWADPVFSGGGGCQKLALLF